jgi:hypothetical protein
LISFCRLGGSRQPLISKSVEFITYEDNPAGSVGSGALEPPMRVYVTSSARRNRTAWRRVGWSSCPKDMQ